MRKRFQFQRYRQEPSRRVSGDQRSGGSGRGRVGDQTGKVGVGQGETGNRELVVPGTNWDLMRFVVVVMVMSSVVVVVVSMTMVVVMMMVSVSYTHLEGLFALQKILPYSLPSLVGRHFLLTQHLSLSQVAFPPRVSCVCVLFFEASSSSFARVQFSRDLYTTHAVG